MSVSTAVRGRHRTRPFDSGEKILQGSAGAAGANPPLLRVTDLTVRFGGIVALDHVSFDVDGGQICGLIGPNGAGKTTFFNCLSRLYPYQEGTILFDGRALEQVPRHGIASAGIGRTFQNLALFRTLTVRENVMLGAHARSHGGFLACALRLPGARHEEQRVRQRADELMNLVGLDAYATRPVADLPFGIQNRVELSRALARAPRLLLLDEPAAGLNHEEVEGLMGVIRRIRDALRITVLLVEHHMNLVMRTSDKVVALDFGRKIADGTPDAVQQDAEVIRAYLGGGA
ncbi:MAG: ABC transporter ATP-binding protein [Burkholderiales bacterium]|nr:ABC transporter ATP-binding protein [Burkholderiales bacterium]